MLVLIPVVGCGLFTVITLGGVNQVIGLTRDVLEGGELMVRADERPAIVARVQELGRLETVNYTIEKVIEGSVDQGNPILNVFLGDRLLLIAHGNVIAGVDLTQLTEDDVQLSEDGASVRLRLPPAIILTHRLDNEKSYVYDRRRGLFTKGDPDLETEVRRAAEQQLLLAACEGGILEQARENAQRQLTALLLALDIDQVEFDPSARSSPTGCE